MTLGLAAVLFGALLVYAGVAGKPLGALLRGDSTATSGRQPLGAPASQTAGTTGGGQAAATPAHSAYPSLGPAFGAVS